MSWISAFEVYST